MKTFFQAPLNGFLSSSKSKADTAAGLKLIACKPPNGNLCSQLSLTVIAILALWIGREFVREGESAWAFALVVLTITMLCGVFVIGKYLTKVELHMRSELVPNDAQPQLPPDTTNTS